MLRNYVFFLLLAGNLSALDDAIVVNASTVTAQGEWMALVLSDYAPREGFDARFLVRFLSPEGRELIKKETFPLTGTFGLPRQALVLGMYIEWLPGIYTLEINSLRTGWKRTLQVTLEDRDYPSAELTLNRALTQLVTRPDPRKEADTAEFIAILDRYEPEPTPELPLFRLPVRDAHRRSSPFGVRRTYRYSTGRSSVSYHWGVDLAGPEGTDLYAPADGKVLLAKDRVVSGNSVILEHMPGVLSIYYHMHTLNVSPGQVVREGDLLGTLGTTGLSTGPHLHWEVRVHGIPVSPLLLLEKLLLDTSGPES